MVDCCIIILNYNSFKDTCRLTLSLLELKLEIIIVDNNSSDNSYIEFTNQFKDNKNVHIIKNKENKGYSHGNNIGMKYAIEKFHPILFLIVNPDVKINKNFIANMKSYLLDDPKLAVLTGVMKSPTETINAAEIAWRLPNGYDDIFLNSGLLNKFHNPVTYDSINSLNKHNNVYYVDCIPGSCFMIKADVMEKIGFFDENVFLYCEERILAKKIKDIGMKTGISLKDCFVHYHKNQKKLKNLLIHKIWLYQSRFYYNIHYTKYGKLISPLIILSFIIGLFETLVMYILRH